ncbi:SDR family oxidoreductase [Roseinatronobacter sp. NSM]|uniref:SDR family oxidoreductase n=1 Tax=Roseinatronobacter sp. NSM TaxID=3457785 RepID=UPI0040363D30
MRLTGKTVLVTAAGQGIGRAAAMGLAMQGAQVIATDINASLLDYAGPCGAGQVLSRELDVCNPQAIAALQGQLPDLDGLFNCAGMVHQGSILDLSDDDWARSVDVNVTSMVRMCRAFLPGLLRQAQTGGTAAILNMASMASSVKGFPNRAAYGATKAAVIGLTKAIAADFVQQGVRCNALCPGTIETPSLRGRIAQAADPAQARRDFIARQPMGRLGNVDDLVPMIVYLLSDESRFMTGQAVLVDGGVTI